MADPTADLVVTRSLTIPAAELRWRFAASGGPGGQHANTSNTKVNLSWDIESSAALTDAQRARLLERIGPVARVSVTSQRSQSRNRDLALERLTERLRSALAIRRQRRPTSPTRSSVVRRLETKRIKSTRKSERRSEYGPEA